MSSRLWYQGTTGGVVSQYHEFDRSLLDVGRNEPILPARPEVYHQPVEPHLLQAPLQQTYTNRALSPAPCFVRGGPSQVLPGNRHTPIEFKCARHDGGVNE